MTKARIFLLIFFIVVFNLYLIVNIFVALCSGISDNDPVFYCIINVSNCKLICSLVKFSSYQNCNPKKGEDIIVKKNS